MTQTNFDDYATEYNQILNEQLRFFEKENAYFSEYKVIELKKNLSFSPKIIIDFGCGIGRSAFYLKTHFPEAEIIGVDISEKSLAIAKAQVKEVRFLHANDAELSIITADVVFISCVFHHIPPSEYLKTMRTITALCNVNAMIVTFEHNPYNPVTQYLVRTCPFDKDAMLLKPALMRSLFLAVGLKEIKCRYTLFFPAFLKKLRVFEKYLHILPLGGQYMMIGKLWQKS